MKTDREGLGGFFEAILAVMIVTSGFTVLLVSINLVQSNENGEDASDEHNRIVEICQRLMADERLFRPPYLLLLGNSFLWSEAVEEAMSGFDDYSITLILDLESPRSILLAQKGFATDPGEIISIRFPVDVQMTPSTVHVGILELKVVA